jgi:hypothetical protein
VSTEPGAGQTEFSGRYLGTILSELAASEPLSFKTILSDAHIKIDLTNSSVTTEFPFKGKHQRRLADLAVLNRQGTPLLLIEIKDRDGLKSNEDQIRDYIYYLDHHSTSTTSFLFLSRYEPHAEDERVLLKAKQRGLRLFTLKFCELYGSLRTDRPIAGLLRQYLEEIGVTYREIETESAEKGLKYLAKQAFQFSDNPGFKGLNNASTLDGFSDVTVALLDNLATLGDWIYSHEGNKSTIKRQFRVGISFAPEYDPSRFRTGISTINNKKQINDEIKKVISNSLQSGTVTFYAWANLATKQKQPWVSLEIGLYYYLYPVKKTVLDGEFWIYAAFDWHKRNVDRNNSYDHQLFSFPSEAEAHRQLRQVIRKAATLATKNAPSSCMKVVDRLAIP